MIDEIVKDQEIQILWLGILSEGVIGIQSGELSFDYCLKVFVKRMAILLLAGWACVGDQA